MTTQTEKGKEPAGVVVPTSSTGTDGATEAAEPAVLSPRGSRIIRLDDWTTKEFRMTLGEGEDAEQVVLTADGLRVTVAQASAIQETAAAHGVGVVVEEEK